MFRQLAASILTLTSCLCSWRSLASARRRRDSRQRRRSRQSPRSRQRQRRSIKMRRRRRLPPAPSRRALISRTCRLTSRRQSSIRARARCAQHVDICRLCIRRCKYYLDCCLCLSQFIAMCFARNSCAACYSTLTQCCTLRQLKAPNPCACLHHCMRCTVRIAASGV